jgi:hypothetical protein
MLIHTELYIQNINTIRTYIPLHASYESSSYTIIRAIISQIKTTMDIISKYKKAPINSTTKSFILIQIWNGIGKFRKICIRIYNACYSILTVNPVVHLLNHAEF